VNDRRILLTGSRDWTNERHIRVVLFHWGRTFPAATLVYGGCRGADRMAADIWTGWHWPVELHLAPWGEHGRAAGPIRNQHMVSLGADLCLAFLCAQSRGTRHCAALAEQAGIPTVRIEQEDTT
jgi:hypothetical protein